MIAMQKIEESKEKDFEPSMKSLLRIMNALSEQDHMVKTNLSRHTNLNYVRLARHIAWLERKGLIESVIKEGKVNVVLTNNGRLFNSMLSV
jgi:predicted transcriptional regulator